MLVVIESDSTNCIFSGIKCLSILSPNYKIGEMRYKNFEKTGKKVSALGFGGMRFDPENEEMSLRAVQRAAELGINYFDTAPGYCEDTSERFIGKALSELPKEQQEGLYISTKSHISADPKADDVRRRIDDQLKKFHRDKIEFYNMWCILDLEQFRNIMAPGGPYEGALKAKKEGLIEHICASTHASGEEIAEIVKADVFMLYIVIHTLDCFKEMERALALDTGIFLQEAGR